MESMDTGNEEGEAMMKAQQQNGATQKLQRREICGYVAVAYKESVKPKFGSGWLYLRKHSNTKLFLANLPWPVWLPYETAISEANQTLLQAHVAKLIPGGKSIEAVFPTGNGRLATRIDMTNEAAVNKVLARPSDHVYLPARDQMRQSASTVPTAGYQPPSLLERWLKEYEAARDEGMVTKWSNAAMKTFEKREKKEAHEKRLAAAKGEKPDADGFVMVTKGPPQMKAAEAVARGYLGRVGKGRYKTTRNRKALLDLDKGVEKIGFYRWQRKNESALTHLRDKFRSDQKRVAAVRGLKSMDIDEKPEPKE